MDTVKHQVSRGGDTEYFLDLDLAVLGRPSQGIAKSWSFIGDTLPRLPDLCRPNSPGVPARA